MNETSTPTNRSTESLADKQATPRQSTLRFLKNFARAYTADTRLAVGLQGFVLN